MVESITAGEKRLGHIFCDDYAFSIPAYQRPYSWTPEQAGELLDDLTEAMGEDGDVAEAAPYFLGSVVLIKTPQGRAADVVDGQQRLTTLTILFSVLRDMAEQPNVRDSAHRLIAQPGDFAAGLEDAYRLAIRPRDAEFFRRHVQEGASVPPGAAKSDVERNIVANREYLEDQLGAFTPERRRRLLQYAVQRCFLVVVEASDRASAYRIFSVLNNRGLDLSATDILKAEIIGALPERDQPRYTEVWEGLEEDLGREAFGDLFSHLRMIHRRQKMRGGLEAEFKAYVRPTERPAAFIDDELEPAAERFQQLRTARYAVEGGGATEKIERTLRGLALLDNQDWMPPAIAYALRHGHDGEKMVRFLKALDRLAYYLFVCRANINYRLTRYGEVLKAIEDGDEAALFSERALDLTEEQRAHMREVLDGPLYETIRIRKPVLLRLDEALSDGSAHYDCPTIQIEHVLPQNPGADSDWLDAFPDNEERAAWTHRLGNLVLLSRYKNAAASNYEFERKKDAYFLKSGSSPFVVTSRLAGLTAWTPEVLEDRQSEAVGALCELWSL